MDIRGLMKKIYDKDERGLQRALMSKVLRPSAEAGDDADDGDPTATRERRCPALTANIGPSASRSSSMTITARICHEKQS